MRLAGTPVKFVRKVAFRSIGDNHISEVENYIAQLWPDIHRGWLLARGPVAFTLHPLRSQSSEHSSRLRFDNRNQIERVDVLLIFGPLLGTQLPAARLRGKFVNTGLSYAVSTKVNDLLGRFCCQAFGKRIQHVIKDFGGTHASILSESSTEKHQAKSQ